MTQKKKKTQYSHTQRNKHKNYYFLIIPLNPNDDRVHFEPANTINIKLIKQNQSLNQKNIVDFKIIMYAIILRIHKKKR